MRIIDADEVIKFYANFINEHGFDLKDARFSIRDIEMNLWNIPTVNQWIPCSERLPEEREWAGTIKFGTTKSDEVYVTFESPKGERFCRHVCFQNGKLSNYDQSCIDAWFKGSKPVAWMSLPKPYEEEE